MACPVDLLCFIKSSNDDIRVEAYNYEADGHCAMGLIPTLKNVGDESIEISEVRIGNKVLPQDVSIPPNGYHTFDFSEDGITGEDTVRFVGEDFEVTGTIVYEMGEFECPSYLEYTFGSYWIVLVLAVVLTVLISSVVLFRKARKSKS